MTDPEQVVEANLRFYFALESLDLDLMDEVWATDASAICIYPGEKAQALHFDDGFYPFPRPRPAISISVIGAIDAFTGEWWHRTLPRRPHMAVGADPGGARGGGPR